MAIGAYTMAILVLEAGFSFWLSLPIAVLAAMLFGVIVGLPSLRLRADYFAIATIAMAEVVRLFAQNARELTGGNQGLFCDEDDPSACYPDAWRDVSESINDLVSTSSGAIPIPVSAASWSILADRRNRHCRPQLHPADAMGTGSASDPRGRGRGAGARQEHAPIQAPVAGDLGVPGGDRGLLPRAQPAPRSTRSTTSRW